MVHSTVGRVVVYECVRRGPRISPTSEPNIWQRRKGVFIQVKGNQKTIVLPKKQPI